MPGTHGYVWSHSRRGFQLQMEFIKVAAQLTLRQGCFLGHAGAQNEVEGTMEERLSLMLLKWRKWAGTSKTPQGIGKGKEYYSQEPLGGEPYSPMSP